MTWGGKIVKELKVGIISFAHGHGFSYANALEEIENVVIAGVADDDSERGRRMMILNVEEKLPLNMELLFMEHMRSY